MKSFLRLGLLFPLAAGALAGDLDSWAYASRLTCTGYNGAESLTRFPLLVRVSPAVIPGFAYSQLSDPVSGSDLRFTVDGAIALPREIDTWNTNGESLIWVQLPTLSSPAETVDMVWGGHSAHTGSTTPWDEAAIGVWHLGVTNAPDSSTNAFHGQAYGAVAPADGVLGGACDFTANTAYIDAGSNTLFAFGTNDFTLSAWLRSDPLNQYEAFLGTYAGASKGFMLLIHITGNILNLWANGAYLPAGAAVTDDLWTHVAFQREGTNAFFYMNGTRLARVAPPTVLPGGSFQIGAGGASWANNRFDGRLDEVRVESLARSSNWLWACWRQDSGPGFLQARPVTPWMPALAAAAPSAVAVDGGTLNASLLSTGSSETVVTLFRGPSDGGRDASAWAVTNAFPAHTGSAFPAPYSQSVSWTPGAWHFHAFRAANAAGETWAAGEAVMAGEVSLQVADATGAETGKVVDVTVLRPAWSTNLPLTVAYELGGTAANGSDYSNLTGLLTFPVLATQAVIRIAPLNDFRYEGPESVTLALLPGPYAIGSSNAVTLAILEANKVVHVATNGAAIPPYGDWANAATTIQAAVQYAAVGDTVRIGDGTYTGVAAPATVTAVVTVAKNIRVESANGPDAVIVDALSATRQRGLLLTNAPLAVVSGLTFRRGRVTGTYDHGGGAFVVSGTVENCVFRDNFAQGFGGGLFLKGGLATGCLVSSNLSFEHSYGAGGGVYLAAGELADSRILTNRCLSSAGGGGIYLADGLVRNCLVARNVTIRNEDPLFSPGGGIRMVKGSVLHSTIVSNYSEGDGGGILLAGGGVTNCVVADNLTGPFVAIGGVTRNIARTGGSVAYTCAFPLQPGDGNLESAPLFADPDGDYRLGPGSPCRDTATPEHGTERDLEGILRPVDGNGDGTAAPDMGAYEAGPPASGALRCAFACATNTGFASLPASFQAFVSGSATSGLTLRWDLNKGRSPAMLAEGADLFTVATNYGPGLYSVELIASNGAGETARYSLPDFIRVAPETAYVALDGGHIHPFATPANASTSILDAVAAAGEGPGGTGTVIRIGPGVYRTPGMILVDKPLSLIGEGGPQATLIQSAALTFRPLFLSHPGAWLSGVTVQGPDGMTHNYYYGAALRLHAGTVSNCVIRNTRARSAGGGVYMTNGLLTHCTFASNSVTEWQLGYGGGLYLGGGLVQYCRFASNTTYSHQGGGAVYMTGGILRNCLLTNNTGAYKSDPNYSKGGAVRMTGGLIESCTLADNFSEGPGGGVYMTGGAISNTIAYFNTVDPRNLASLANLARVPDTAGSVGHTCATPLPSGTGNLNLDPSFADRPAGDYGLSAASPCVNAGTNRPWMADALDLSGAPRIESGTVDLGAFEAPDASGGPLVVSFAASETAGFTNLAVVFTASAIGSDTNLTGFWWDFNAGRPPAMQAEGADLRVVTNTFPAGLYSVRLVARNGSGEYATNLTENLILVSPDVLYVSTNGTPAMPYLSRETAAASVHEAVLAAAATNPSVILVGPGVYSNASPVNVAKPVAILGEEGPAATVLRHTDGRIMHLNHPLASAAGLTLANGRLTGTSDQGAGLLLENGTASNCVIRDCTQPAQGGGVHVKAGLLVDCLVTGNTVTEWQYGYGGGIYLSGGLVDRCVVVSNVSRSHRGGGGIYLNGGAVRNTLVAWNEARPTSNPGNFGDAGGVLVAKGSLENCTVVFNTASTNCGGVIVEGTLGGVTNCIVLHNAVTNNPAPAQDFLNPARTAFSCSPDLTNGVDGNLTADPLFVSTNAPFDFRLRRESPCREAATNLDWMAAGGLDLDGRARPQGKQADMGAYESEAPRTGILLMLY